MKRILLSVIAILAMTSNVLACTPSVPGDYNVVNNIVNYGVMNNYSNYGGYQENVSYDCSYEATAEYDNSYCHLCGLTWDLCTCYDNVGEMGYGSCWTMYNNGMFDNHSYCDSNNARSFDDFCYQGCMEGQDLTGSSYYDSQGHLCTYGGYWEGGQWITTVGYYENGCWYPAQYDPMLDVGYYDANGNYYSYCGYGYEYNIGNSSYDCRSDWSNSGNWDCNYTDCAVDTCFPQPVSYECYDETTPWAADAYPGGYDCSYYEYDECDYSDCSCDGYWIDVDVNTDTINIINNGTIILSGSCTCANGYSGQELCFGDQKCAGIWNTCSQGFYSQACEYMTSGCTVRCH